MILEFLNKELKEKNRMIHSSDSLKAIGTPLALEALWENMIKFFPQPHWLVHILSLDARLCLLKKNDSIGESVLLQVIKNFTSFVGVPSATSVKT